MGDHVPGSVRAVVSRSRSRAVGSEVRRLRTSAQLSLVDLANRTGFSKSTLARIETGERVASDTELAVLLGALGVPAESRNELLDMTREAQRANWIATGPTGIPAQLAMLLDYERTTIAVTDIELALVPGLLQTRAYCRAVHIGCRVPPGEVDTRVAIRLGRQEILTRSNPVTLSVVIDEAVLHRVVGDRATAAEQFRHLIRMAKRRNITIQVLPLADGIHPAVESSFLLYEFAHETPVAHIESPAATVFIDEPKAAAQYKALAVAVQEQALSPEESLRVIERYANTLEGKERGQ